MKAIIQAAGLGTRLYPITKDTPKPLVKIGSKPILEHQIEFLKINNIIEITIVVSYLKDKIIEYFQDGSNWGVSIQYHYEQTPIGTAGSLKYLEDDFQETFLVLYCDYFLDFNLKKMRDFHQRNPLQPVSTILAQPVEYPAEVDHLQLSTNFEIENFITRPLPKGIQIKNCSSTGIYICDNQIFKYIKNDQYQSFEKDVFPSALNHNKKLFAYYTEEYIQDIGTHSRLKKIEHQYTSGKYKKYNAKLFPKHVTIPS